MSKLLHLFFRPVPTDLEEEEVLRSLRISNAQRIFVISFVGLFFAFLLMALDYVRYSNGTMEIGNVQFYLFINHFALFLFIIPIIILRKNRKTIAVGEYKHGRFFIHCWAIFLGLVLVIMSILTLKDRSSLAIYYIYIIIANFGLLMIHSDRMLLNGASYLVITMAITYLFFDDTLLWFTGIVEATGVTFTSVAVSTQIFNARVKQVAGEKLIEEKSAEIVKEKLRGDQLLNNILPEHIATELKETGRVIPRLFSSASILMLDFKDFGIKSRSMTPTKLVEILDFCFKNFDRITEKHKLEKIKTIGDAYLCVGGVPKENNTHSFDCIAAAKEILAFMANWEKQQQVLGEPFFEARIGIHTGEVIAGVVGDKKFAFDIWGDAVNTTARVEAAGEVGKINISQTTFVLVQSKLKCTHRGKIPIKNGEPLDMYFVDVKDS